MSLGLDSEAFEGGREKQNTCSSVFISVDLWRGILPKSDD